MIMATAPLSCRYFVEFGRGVGGVDVDDDGPSLKNTEEGNEKLRDVVQHDTSTIALDNAQPLQRRGKAITGRVQAPR